MRTTLDIPDELARVVQQHAQKDGRELVEQIVRLVKLGLLVTDIPAAEFERMIREARRAVSTIDVHAAPHHVRPFVFSTDPSTGLPVVDSPPDAPIRSMSMAEVSALVDESQLEEDLERAGLPVRH